MWAKGLKFAFAQIQQKSVEYKSLSEYQGFHAYYTKQVIPRHTGRSLTYSWYSNISKCYKVENLVFKNKSQSTNLLLYGYSFMFSFAISFL